VFASVTSFCNRVGNVLKVVSTDTGTTDLASITAAGSSGASSALATGTSVAGPMTSVTASASGSGGDGGDFEVVGKWLNQIWLIR
jgi:hypothetical protein